MRVHIIGPNLRDQSLGDFHVHAEGCADVQRNRDYQFPDYQHDREHPVEVVSIQQIVEYTYADQIAEGSMTWHDGVADFHLFPCCIDQLPSVTPPQFRVEIHGEYGVKDGSIHLFNGDQEIVMWDSAEWVEDPSLVYVIANAIINKGVPQ